MNGRAFTCAVGVADAHGALAEFYWRLIDGQEAALRSDENGPTAAAGTWPPAQRHRGARM